VRTVDERIAVAPVGLVEQLAQAVGARGDVGRDELEFARRGVRGKDAEAKQRAWVTGLDIDMLDPRQRRGVPLQRLDEGLQRGIGSADLDLDAGGGVADPAFQPEGESPVVHKRSEANSLHDTAHAKTAPLTAGRSLGRRGDTIHPGAHPTSARRSPT
jgi:hypothetical protein